MNKHDQIDASRTADRLTVWPPSPVMLATLPTRQADPFSLDSVKRVDLFVYVAVWTVMAKIALATACCIYLEDWKLWYDLAIGANFQGDVARLPFDVGWVACVVCFGLLQRTGLMRSVVAALGACLAQVAVFCATATLIHAFAADSWQPSNLANRIHAINRTLLIYGTAAGLASLAAGGTLSLTMRRQAARTP